jgi:NAD+ kinase
VKAPGTITVLTRRDPRMTAGAVRRVIEVATERGIRVNVPAEEVAKHRLEEREGAVFGADPGADTDLAVVLGGDGTILSTMRLFAGRQVPVFAFNYGAIGFLATYEHEQLAEGLDKALSGSFDVLELPVLRTLTNDGDQVAVNDMSFARQAAGRVAELAYSIQGEELGQVRCDGLVVSTPAGSTGYNLANGGPILAWGVEGFVVSFIAPITLTARALVVATNHVLEVANLSREEDVEIAADGRPAGLLERGESVELRFEDAQALLAQRPGATFYHRLRDKFGRLAY